MLMKNSKWKILISSLLILLPISFGFALWNKLPSAPILNSSAEKVLLIILPSLLLLGAHIVCLVVTSLDHKKIEQNVKVVNLVIYTMPVLSFYVNGLIYAIVLGLKFNVGAVISVLMGVSFCVMGNYMPKIKRNRTVGVKIKWTLASENNWNATHRFTGKVWVVGGVISLFGVFLPLSWLPAMLFPLLALMVIPPIVYSHRYYKKQMAAGGDDVDAQFDLGKNSVTALIVIGVLIALLFSGVGVLMFTGNVSVSYDTEKIVIDADYHKDLTVFYAEIESVELASDFDVGARVMGYASARLLMGWFQTPAFGDYTLYAYTNAANYVILTVDGQRVVIGLQDAQAGVELYEQICNNVKN